MKLKIAISPCPNDTFIFDAIYSKKIDTSPFHFDFEFEDVETLNKRALDQSADIIKLSYANYFNVLNHYIMLRSGGALGEGVGPLLIAAKNYSFDEYSGLKVAIPGEYTTANFLLKFALPDLHHKKVYVFSEIEQAVLNNETDAGVIIHENRFTYMQKGLYQLLDLGEFWERKTGLPIPLGGIAVKRSLAPAVHQQLNELIRQSILFAKKSFPVLTGFITQHAQEMSEEVMRKHIGLYVNDYSLDLGTKGLEAVRTMSGILNNKSEQKLFM